MQIGAPSIHGLEKIIHTSESAKTFISGVSDRIPPEHEQSRISLHPGFMTWFVLGGICRYVYPTNRLSGSDAWHSLNTVGKALKTELVQEMASEWIDELQKATVSLQNVGKLPHAGQGQNSEGGSDACIADRENRDSMDLFRALDKLTHRIRELSGEHGVVGAMPSGQPHSRLSISGSMLPATNDHAPDGWGLRNASNHSSSRPRSGIDAADRRNIQLGSGPDATIHGSEQMSFDPNELPSAATATSDLDLGDAGMLLHLDMWQDP